MPRAAPNGTAIITANEQRAAKVRFEEWARRPKSCRRVNTLQRQRIQRSDEDGGRTRWWRNRLLSTSAPSREIGANRPPCFSADARKSVKRKTAADENAQDEKDEHAARRISGERVHRGSGTPERTREGAEQRQREGQDRQQNGPYPSAHRAFSITTRGVQQRRAREATASAKHSRPGPRTTSRPSRVRNRPRYEPIAMAEGEEYPRQ